MDKKGSVWVYQALWGSNILALKFSGDIDAAVPTAGTENWINDFDRDVTEEWRPFYLNKDDDTKVVAGYIEVYENWLTFGTIHGAGHMTPTDKPAETYHLIFNWMKGSPI